MTSESSIVNKYTNHFTSSFLMWQQYWPTESEKKYRITMEMLLYCKGDELLITCI